MKTLYEQVTEIDMYQQRKHGLRFDYAEDKLNALTNYEFLERLSKAQERMFEEFRLEVLRAAGVHITDWMD